MMKQSTVYDESEVIDDETFLALWGDEFSLYAHDASESVEDWWTKWEPVIVRANPNRRSLGPSLEILKNNIVLVS
jgi:salicylate hydroxylase